VFAFIRKILFLWSPERAHHLTMNLLMMVLKIPGCSTFFQTVMNPRNIDGIKYRNPVGLAAGFDKDGKYIEALYQLGFGFIEVGTVTPLGQPGNDKPRLFRLPNDRALINRLGFNNDGMEALKQNLEKFRQKHPNCDMPIGVNIGKNKNTPNEEADEDYFKCYSYLYDLSDFFVVNVSSPNTPNLRELQGKDALKKILERLLEYRKKQKVNKPLYLKIAPDLTDEQLSEIIDLQRELQFEGMVATNTTLDRTVLKNTPTAIVNQMGAGGLSGAPIFEKSTEFVAKLRSQTQMTIIGVGGIDTAEKAAKKIEAGADLVEIYTGFVYAGPALIKKAAQL
jgi:dihydroorotate dehydrogenase